MWPDLVPMGRGGAARATAVGAAQRGGGADGPHAIRAFTERIPRGSGVIAESVPNPTLRGQRLAFA
jgi:hypothetical protein